MLLQCKLKTKMLKKIVAYSTIITCMAAAYAQGPLTKQSTYKILPGNSKDDLVIKAAHVVPTRNQYRALKSEFITFVHFGPRYTPAISTISAHYYEPGPPQLQITADANGMITVAPKEHEFGWKSHGENTAVNINKGVQIFNTTDGSNPTEESNPYTQPVFASKGEVKAIAISKKIARSIVTMPISIAKKNWKLISSNQSNEQHPASKAFDANGKTYWQSGTAEKQFINIDLRNAYSLKGFSYTLHASVKNGMMQKGVIRISDDGVNGKDAGSFSSRSLINERMQVKSLQFCLYTY